MLCLRAGVRGGGGPTCLSCCAWVVRTSTTQVDTGPLFFCGRSVSGRCETVQINRPQTQPTSLLSLLSSLSLSSSVLA